jgi:hypothetical protein
MTENNAAVTDVECLNCFNAISAVRAHRHYIARVQGQPINIGIFIDEMCAHPRSLTPHQLRHRPR